MIFLKGGSIKGLTTAAGIWSTAAVGMAIGCGMYVVGIISTVIIIVIQIVFHTFLIGYDRVLANDNTKEMIVKMKNSPQAVDRLKEKLKAQHIDVESSKIDLSDDCLMIVMTVRSDGKLGFDESSALMLDDPDIHSVSL